jgi:hypothetical protein
MGSESLRLDAIAMSIPVQVEDSALVICTTVHLLMNVLSCCFLNCFQFWLLFNGCLCSVVHNPMHAVGQVVHAELEERGWSPQL